MHLGFHPIANCFPLIEGREFDELVADIRVNGVREPVLLLDGKILDGRNRYRASLIADVPLDFLVYGNRDSYTLEQEGNRDGTYTWIAYEKDETGEKPLLQLGEYLGELEDPIGFVVSLNLRRRHLSEGQRAWVAAQIANLGHGQKRSDTSIDVSAVTQSDAATMLNVSLPSVQRATVVRDLGVPELQEKVAKGYVAPSSAAEVARLPQPEQREIVAKGEKEILEAAKRIRSEKAEARRAELVEVAATKAAMPDGKFETIIIDPPWPMQKIERDVRPNQVAFEYPTMSEDELRAFGDKVNDASADDCHMFMWTTHKFLPMALRLLESWGFRYVMTMVWHKPGGFQPIGLPQYNCEFCLYARKGSPSFAETKAFNACFDAPRREHSRKPDEFYDVIKRVTFGPRIDIFSREARDGFAQFGNEADLFNGAAA